MHLEYTLNFADYKRATILITDKIPSYHKNKIQYSLVTGILLFPTIPCSFFRKIIVSILFFLLNYFFLFNLLTKFLLEVNFSAQIKQGKNQNLKEIDLIINKRGFIYNSMTDEREERVSIPWTKVTLAVKTEEMYIFYTSVFSTLYMLKLENEIDEDLTRIEQLLNEYYVPFKIL